MCFFDFGFAFIFILILTQPNFLFNLILNLEKIQGVKRYTYTYKHRHPPWVGRVVGGIKQEKKVNRCDFKTLSSCFSLSSFHCVIEQSFLLGERKGLIHPL